MIDNKWQQWDDNVSTMSMDYHNTHLYKHITQLYVELQQRRNAHVSQ